MKKWRGYFSRGELLLWGSSTVLIVAAFCFFEGNGMMLAASLLGVTSILLNAKGNPLGQLLMICFSLLYGVISYSFAYYGEMITYLGMTMPMAVVALVSWLRHPYAGKRSEVQVGSIGKKEVIFLLLLTAAVTAVFWRVLVFFHTTNIVWSTVSVTTSFLAIYLTFRRSPYFSLAYAANDVVLIFLWLYASKTDAGYLSVVVCFAAFLLNDVYGFRSWQRMKKRQDSFQH